MVKMLRKLKPIAIAVSAVMLFASIVIAQSNDQNFPTPVYNSEISGVIKSRDVGDSRLTSHYYTFEGGQGDLFINVQTSNLSGDVDVFAIPGLRPLTKMVMYADAAASETGRVLYLRKPETILLRIQGRTPGDEEASYRIKFAGSFLASKSQDTAPEAPKVDSETQTNVRVNSVGTIVEVVPKETPAPKEESPRVPESARKVDEKDTPESAKKGEESRAEVLPPKQEVVITDPLAVKEKLVVDKEESKKAPARRNSRSRRNSRREAEARKDQELKDAEREVTDQKDAAVTEDEVASEKEPSESRNAKVEQLKPVDPMAGIRLVIRFKNGGVIERPMTEVSKFTVERAVLTVVNKNGSVGRYQMIEVAGVTIE